MAGHDTEQKIGVGFASSPQLSSRQSSQVSTPCRSHVFGRPDPPVAYEHAFPFVDQQSGEGEQKANGPLLTSLTPVFEDGSPGDHDRSPLEVYQRSFSSMGTGLSGLDENMLGEIVHSRQKAFGTTPHHLHPSRRPGKHAVAPKSHHNGPSKQTVGRRDTPTLTRHPLGAPFPPVPFEDSAPAAGDTDLPLVPLSVELGAGKLACLTSEDDDTGGPKISHTSTQLDTPEASGDADSGSPESFNLDIPGKWLQTPWLPEPNQPNIAQR